MSAATIAAIAAPPPAASPPAASAPAASAPAASPPDDSFFEFLGSDDVGDARWWDYLMKAEPRAEEPAPPPQEAKK